MGREPNANEAANLETDYLLIQKVLLEEHEMMKVELEIVKEDIKKLKPTQ